MNKIILSLLIVQLLSTTTIAQNKSRFSASASYGLNGNFFVRTFDEEDGPQPHQYFYKKNFLGTIGGVGLSYHLNSKSFLTLEFNRSVNKSRKNYGASINGVDFFISNFKLSFINSFYQLGYSRNFNAKKSSIIGEAGILYLVTNNQSITIDGGLPGSTFIDIRETSLKYTGSEEGGFFFGAAWQHDLKDNFSIGLRMRAYYLVSIGVMEAITLTPVLRYRF